MNKRNKITAILMLIVMVLSVIGIRVQAATATVLLEPKSSQVALGTEFPVKVKVTNIDAGQGISRFEATLDYDEKMFNKIGPTSIEGMNNWQIQYDASTKKIIAKNDAFVKDDSDLMQITFKVKTKAEIQSTKKLDQPTDNKVISEKTSIGLKSINANNALSTFKINDVAQTIQVGETVNPGETQKDPSSGTLTPTPVPTQPNLNPEKEAEKNKPIESVKKEEQEEAKKPDKISHAGVEDTPLFLLAALLGVAVISYLGYKKFAEKA